MPIRTTDEGPNSSLTWKVSTSPIMDRYTRPTRASARPAIGLRQRGVERALKMPASTTSRRPRQIAEPTRCTTKTLGPHWHGNTSRAIPSIPHQGRWLGKDNNEKSQVPATVHTLTPIPTTIPPPIPQPRRTLTINHDPPVATPTAQLGSPLQPTSNRPQTLPPRTTPEAQPQTPPPSTPTISKTTKQVMAHPHAPKATPCIPSTQNGSPRVKLKFNTTPLPPRTSSRIKVPIDRLNL